MPLYIAGKLASHPPTSGDGVPQTIPAKVEKNCARYLPLEENEELVLLVDETLLGSGKEGVAITSRRLLSFDKEKLRLNLPFGGLEGVETVKLEFELLGLLITRSGGRSLRLALKQVSPAEVAVVAAELAARLAKPGEETSAWCCPSCGPGEVLYLERVAVAPGGGAKAMLARGFHLCRGCGRAVLQIADPAAIDLEKLDARLMRSR